jgi:hypothetical protein
MEYNHDQKRKYGVRHGIKEKINKERNEEKRNIYEIKTKVSSKSV